MTYKKLEALLLGARPTPQTYSPFTHSVMQQIQSHATFASHAHIKSKQPKRSLLMKLRTLSGQGLVFAIVIAATLASGVVYASVRFVPDLIQIIDKKVNSEGRTEYTAPGFASCDTTSGPKLDTFEIKQGTDLSDSEVKKVLQAKCELLGMAKFASDTWPTYGQRKAWQNGDTIHYTRPDLLGTVQKIDDRSVIILHNGGTKTYTTFENKKLEAYLRNERIDLSTIKPGDLVFAITRVRETYYTHRTGKEDPGVRDLGIVAVVKMILPERYYFGMQSYLYEVLPCMGNPDERCATGMATGSIDVFPRTNGEMAINPDVRPSTDTTLAREINGMVTTIKPNAFTITSTTGRIYEVQLAKSLLDLYNSGYAPQYYSQPGAAPDKIRIRPGSRVSILYTQSASDNAQQIAHTDIVRVMLLVDLPPK
jgi:hypothetical protein